MRPTRTGYLVVVLDMAGTTVSDQGVVLEAFSQALGAVGIAPEHHRYDTAMAIASSTMGRSKIDVFRTLLAEVREDRSTDLEGAAQEANRVFEASYEQFVSTGRIEPIPGAMETVMALRAAAISVCMVTGFSERTRDFVLRALGWEGLADLVLSPGDAGRGRPWPDLPLLALTRLGGASVSELAVVGDTPADMENGIRAGAGLVGGVLTGSSRADALFASGANVVLSSVAELPGALGL